MPTSNACRVILVVMSLTCLCTTHGFRAIRSNLRVGGTSRGQIMTAGSPLKSAGSLQSSRALVVRGGAGDSLAHECGEAAAYGFVYAIAAALTGGVAEGIFPDYNEKKNALVLTLEIAGTNGRGSGKHPPAREKNWSSAARNKYP